MSNNDVVADALDVNELVEEITNHFALHNVKPHERLDVMRKLIKQKMSSNATDEAVNNALLSISKALFTAEMRGLQTDNPTVGIGADKRGKTSAIGRVPPRGASRTNYDRGRLAAGEGVEDRLEIVAAEIRSANQDVA